MMIRYHILTINIASDDAQRTRTQFLICSQKVMNNVSMSKIVRTTKIHAEEGR